MGAQADRMRNHMLLLTAVLGPWLTSTACAPVDAAPPGKATAASPSAEDASMVKPAYVSSTNRPSLSVSVASL